MEEKICYKIVYYTLHLSFKPIARNRVSKLEFIFIRLKIV